MSLIKILFNLWKNNIKKLDKLEIAFAATMYSLCFFIISMTVAIVAILFSK